MKIKLSYFLFFFLFSIVFSFAQNSLKLAAVFSNGMVLQRNHEIPVWGTSNPDETIKVVFKEHVVFTKSDSNGNWKILLKEQKAGGPFQLIISTEKEKIQLKDILMGDVWLASGQSNMHLDLKRTLNGEEVAKKANNPNIRIYNMKPTYPTGKGGVHTLEELEKIQNNKYFNTKGWVKASPENVLYFSAVAYYFAEKLQGELNIPIGVIHNAVPGSPIESWIPENILEKDSVVSSLIKQRWMDKEDEKDGMISVAKNQISSKQNKNQKHPWMPNYNYVNGILPIKNTIVKGVIWYQGESNAEHPKLYKKMFADMVQTWRSDWGINFPFYYVQLTSREERPAWPAFRNAQREILNRVPNSKMIVTSDVGDRQDTHAKNKKPVGDRLAILALGDCYGIGKDYESPLFDTIIPYKRNYKIKFKGAFGGLKTTAKQKIIGFEISNDSIHFEKLETKIHGKTVQFKTPKHYKKPIYIRYAWKAYTEANLTSKSGLPVSVFSARIK